MKRFIVSVFSVILAVAAFCGCTEGGDEPPEAPSPEVVHLNTNLSADGFVRDKIGDFSVYENTDAYRKVTTADEFVQAIVAAKCHYTNVWNDETGTYAQKPASGYTTAEGSVHAIEIANDLNLGYNVLSAAAKSSGVADDFSKKTMSNHVNDYNSAMVTENGISQIKIENTSDLLIYSKNGAKLTHCGFKLTSDNNVVFRNLVMDEIWQWEDGPKTSPSTVGDYDFHGWAYFKIAFCGYIWIDHCTFGKSYDGQIDVSNPEYTANAGTEYVSKHAYYDKLRDSGITFGQILYGLALPQKKGFLCGDSGDEYAYNLKLQISFANCTFTNLEDRIPKLRGGNAYMYNCIVDNSQYYSYRAELRAKDAASLVKEVNGKWKCALVSQGIVCGNGGSVKAENCIYRGIEYLLKNNDTNSADRVKGGYTLVNCSYQKGASDAVYTGSSSDAGNKFTNDTPAKLSPENFSWHTVNGEQPFTPSVTPLDGLKEFLGNSDYGSGAHAVTALNFLKPEYC